MAKVEYSDALVECGRTLLEVTGTQMLSGRPDLEHAAMALGLPGRILQRGLYEQDLSYALLRRIPYCNADSEPINYGGFLELYCSTNCASVASISCAFLRTNGHDTGRVR